MATNIVPTPEKVDQWKDSVVARYGLPAPGDVDRDPFGMENPLNKYVGGLDALYEQRIAGTKNLPAGGNMMTPRHVGELMLNQMRAEKPKDHIVVSDGLGSTLFYSIFRHLPTLAGVLVGRGYERSMKAFVRPIKVQEKEAAQRTVVAERELVAA